MKYILFVLITGVSCFNGRSFVLHWGHIYITYYPEVYVHHLVTTILCMYLCICVNFDYLETYTCHKTLSLKVLSIVWLVYCVAMQRCLKKSPSFVFKVIIRTHAHWSVGLPQHCWLALTAQCAYAGYVLWNSSVLVSISHYWVWMHKLQIHGQHWIKNVLKYVTSWIRAHANCMQIRLFENFLQKANIHGCS